MEEEFEGVFIRRQISLLSIIYKVFSLLIKVTRDVLPERIKCELYVNEGTIIYLF